MRFRSNIKIDMQDGGRYGFGTGSTRISRTTEEAEPENEDVDFVQ